VKKAPLKKALYAAFSPYGKILDIVAMKTQSGRGQVRSTPSPPSTPCPPHARLPPPPPSSHTQAFVVFTDVASATNALTAMQSFPLYGKPMRVSFARGKSAAVEKAEGTYKVREKEKRAREEAAPAERQAAKRARPAEAEAGGVAVAAAVVIAPVMPSKTLLVQNLPALPADVLGSMLKDLFGRYAGLVAIRPVEARRLAFVDFADEASSAPALAGLHAFLVDGTNALAVTFAR